MSETLPLEDHIKRLYRDAELKDGVEYIYTLLRVTGPELPEPDPIIRLRDELGGDPALLTDDDVFSRYCSLALHEGPIELLANLLKCARGEVYSVVPFHHLNQGEYPNIRRATYAEKIRELSRLAGEGGRPEIARAIDEAYPTEMLERCATREPPESERLQATFEHFRSLSLPLANICFAERLKYRDWSKFFKISPFMVLELLTDDEYGLYGFRTHFPTGSHAMFERHPESSKGQNFLVRPHIEYFVGLIDDMQKAWQIEGKRLHELELPGRYNPLGEWRPVVAPEAVAVFSEEAQSLSDDPDVQGTLFYILSTGFRAVEFVVRTNIDLPHDSVSFGHQLHLWKCPPLDASPLYNSNLRTYDGWVELDSVDPDHVRHAIAMVGVALNRLAFAYDATLSWRVKYKLTNSQYPLWTPTADDTHLINSLLKDFPDSEDAIVLDAAMDWYTRGRASQNVFTAFLCYYVAVESVERAVAEGKADIGLGYRKEGKAERRNARLECIRERHDRLYEVDPARFVGEAYFDCVVGLKEKTRRVAELVFGAGHPYLNLLFDKGADGHSLTSIRSELAHGGVTLMDRDHEKLVRGRLHELAKISKEFLSRLIFFLQPADPLHSWSRKFSDSMHFTDPRSTMFVNDEIPVAEKDWRIRPEWCD